MNQQTAPETTTNQPTPEERILHLEAQVQELDAMAQYLTQRSAALNAEVRLRDLRLAELEAELAAAQQALEAGS